MDKTKNRNIKSAWLIIALIAMVVLFIVGAIDFHTTDAIDPRFFTDINSYEKLKQYETDDITNDKELNGITPISSYTKKISYNGKTYSVYAYVFEDTESSKEYFENRTGKESYQNYNYSMSTNHFFSSRCIAFYDNCLYYIEGGDYKSFVEAVTFVTESFPLDAEEIRKIN